MPKLTPIQVRRAARMARMHHHQWGRYVRSCQHSPSGIAFVDAKQEVVSTPEAVTPEAIRRHVRTVCAHAGWGTDAPKVGRVGSATVIEHTSACGRLTWSVFPEGTVMLTVSRASGPVLEADIHPDRSVEWRAVAERYDEHDLARLVMPTEAVRGTRTMMEESFVPLLKNAWMGDALSAVEEGVLDIDGPRGRELLAWSRAYRKANRMARDEGWTLVPPRSAAMRAKIAEWGAPVEFEDFDGWDKFLGHLYTWADHELAEQRRLDMEAGRVLIDPNSHDLEPWEFVEPQAIS